MDKSQKFWQKISNKYANQPIANKEAYEHKLLKTKAFYNEQSSLLELGCGTGGTAIIHAPNVKHYHAVDFCSDFIEIAKKQAQEKNISNLAFSQSDLKQLDIQSFDVDMVLALSLLHLLENPQKLIQDIYQSLPKEGVFVSSTACIKEMPLVARWILPIMQTFGFAPPLNSFTENELLNMLKSAGFDIEYQYKPNKNDAIFIIAKK